MGYCALKCGPDTQAKGGQEGKQTGAHTHTHRHAGERNELKYTRRSHNRAAVKRGSGEQKETLQSNFRNEAECHPSTSPCGTQSAARGSDSPCSPYSTAVPSPSPGIITALPFPSKGHLPGGAIPSAATRGRRSPLSLSTTSTAREKYYIKTPVKKQYLRHQEKGERISPRGTNKAAFALISSSPGPVAACQQGGWSRKCAKFSTFGRKLPSTDSWHKSVTHIQKLPKKQNTNTPLLTPRPVTRRRQQHFRAGCSLEAKEPHSARNYGGIGQAKRTAQRRGFALPCRRQSRHAQRRAAARDGPALQICARPEGSAFAALVWVGAVWTFKRTSAFSLGQAAAIAVGGAAALLARPRQDQPEPGKRRQSHGTPAPTPSFLPPSPGEAGARGPGRSPCLFSRNNITVYTYMCAYPRYPYTPPRCLAPTRAHTHAALPRPARRPRARLAARGPPLPPVGCGARRDRRAHLHSAGRQPMAARRPPAQPPRPRPGAPERSPSRPAAR